MPTTPWIWVELHVQARCPGSLGGSSHLGWEVELSSHPSSSTLTELKGHDPSTCSQSAPGKVSWVNSHTVLGSKHVCLLLSAVHSCELQKNDSGPSLTLPVSTPNPGLSPRFPAPWNAAAPTTTPTPCIQPAPSKGSISRCLGSGTPGLAGVRHSPFLLRFAWVTH